MMTIMKVKHFAGGQIIYNRTKLLLNRNINANIFLFGNN